MNIPRHTLSSHVVAPAFVSAQFACATSSSPASPPATTDRGADLFACATSSGFLVAQANPLKVVARRDFPETHGGLSQAAAVDASSLLVLVGGGRVPRFAPNKVILWDEAAAAQFVPPSPPAESSHRPVSPPASTIFSAGSNFDTRAASTSSVASAQSPALTSRTNLSEAERRIDDWRHGALSSSLASTLDKGKALQRLDVSIPDMDASMHSHLAVSATHDDLTASSSSQNLSQSLFERSSRLTERPKSLLNASSAGLDDPFAVGGASPQTSPRLESAHLADEAKPWTRVASPPSSPTSARISTQHVAASASQVSSNHPQMSQPAYPPFEPPPVQALQTGREVAELEFGETVRGISVRAFDARRRVSTKTPVVAAAAVPIAEGKGKRRKANFTGAAAAAEASSKATEATHDKVILLVVLLRKRAVVFEIGAPDQASDSAAGAWEITQRASTEICEGGMPGLAALSAYPSRNSALVALPGRQMGHVQLLRIPLGSGLRTSASGATSILAAHTSHLAALSLSADGTLLATASERGTLLRVWSTVKSGTDGLTAQVSATLLRELRRGTDPARILSVAFAPDRSAIAAASDKGTVHIFNLAPAGDAVQVALGHLGRAAGMGQEQRFNLSRSASRFLPSALGDLASAIPKGMLPKYFQSAWSVAQYRIPLKTFSSQGKAALAKPMRAKRGAGGVHGTTPVGGGGARSTEGAWATMRGRVNDIRRGEPGVEESIFLGWIETIPPSSNTAPVVTGGVAATAPAVEQEANSKWNLVALTSSGGYYRIQLDASDDDQHSAGEEQSIGTGADDGASTVLDMYRDDANSAAGTSSSTATSKRRRRRRRTGDAQGCTLVEYRGFGQRDDWTQM